MPPIVHDVLRAPGRVLDEPTRSFMESRFGHDFSRVRVHADAAAAESARVVNARAYTVGHDVVLGTGEPSVQTPEGRRLLAHELAHVVQDAGDSGTAPSALSVGAASDPAERAADEMAARALSGSALSVEPTRTHGPLVLRRQVRNNVVTSFQKGAQACMVHVHGEERTALAVGKQIRSRRCVNFMHLDTTKRHVDFDFKVSGFDFEGEADPNRIFTPAGRAGPEAILRMGPKPGQKGADKVDKKKIRAAAEQVLREFATQVFVPHLDECRKSTKEAALLPVMALHNNESLSPAKFKPVASTSRSPNPATGAPGDKNDFLLVTREADFDAFKGRFNVVLQESPMQARNDDGSLSVLLAASRFVNVEKEGREHDKPVGPKGLKRQDEIYLKNYAMAGAVLDRYGVSQSPCFEAPTHMQRTKSLFNRRLGQSGRKPVTLATEKPMLARDPLPDPPPKGCRVFVDQPALDRAADDWRARIENFPLLNLVHWALGGARFVPPEPMAEFQKQQRCMLGAMRTSLKGQGLSVPAGDLVESGQRSFAEQKGIWSKKFAFTAPPEFDRISDFARKKCPALGSDVRWKTGDKTHQACWKKLSDAEKQKEILMASSAPGVSRHHAGTDFDIGKSGADLDPKAWTGSGAFADAYRWLARNASAYGFIQPFETQGGYGKGYMAERWHWSYFPVAQAVLEFVMDHEAEVEAALMELWSDGKGGIKPEFSFMASHWRDYLFNVEDVGVF